MSTKTILASLLAAVIAFVAVIIIMLYALNYFFVQTRRTTFTTAEVGVTHNPYVGQAQTAETPTPQSINTADTSAVDYDKYSCYILKEYNGEIGIFAPDDPVNPINVINVNISSLPEFDRQMLKLGITVDSKEELLMTIEDYSS